MSIITSSQNFTVPSGVTRLRVVCIGGGGGGASLTGTINVPTNGGHGGAGEALVPVSGGQVIYCTIGNGGAAAAVAPWPYAGGSAGGTTSFGGYASATGGAGGYIAGPGTPAGTMSGSGSFSVGSGATLLSRQGMFGLYGASQGGWSGGEESINGAGGGGLNGGNGFAGGGGPLGPGSAGNRTNCNGGSGGIIIFY